MTGIFRDKGIARAEKAEDICREQRSMNYKRALARLSEVNDLRIEKLSR